MEVLVALTVLGLVGLAALFGADSRDGRDWQPRSEWEVREQAERARGRAVNTTRRVGGLF